MHFNTLQFSGQAIRDHFCYNPNGKVALFYLYYYYLFIKPLAPEFKENKKEQKEWFANFAVASNLWSTEFLPTFNKINQIFSDIREKAQQLHINFGI
jgi:hypothetical protein